MYAFFDSLLNLIIAIWNSI